MSMTSQQKSAPNEQAQESNYSALSTRRSAFVFDCDVHIHESPPDLAPYMEMPWRRALETAAPAGAERWLDVHGYTPLTALDPLLGDFPEPPPHLVTSPDVLRADLDARGIDGALIFSGQWLGLAGAQDEPYATTVMRAYNRYLRERWVAPERGIHAPIVAAPQNPVAAAAEIEAYAGVPGFAAVWLPSGSMFPLWGHRDYDPIMAAAEAAGLPVIPHGASVVGTLFPYQMHHYDTALAKQALAEPLGAIAMLVNMVTTGMLSRFPRLKVIFPETGVSWLPFVMWRLDDQRQYLPAEAPELTERPSEVIRRSVHLTTHRLERPDDPAHLTAAIAAIGGPEKLLFASDWPHYDASTVAVVDRLNLDEPTRRAVLGGNAARLLKLQS